MKTKAESVRLKQQNRVLWCSLDFVWTHALNMFATLFRKPKYKS